MTGLSTLVEGIVFTLPEIMKHCCDEWAKIGDKEFKHLAYQGNCVLVVQLVIEVASKIYLHLQAATAGHGLKGTWR